MIKYLSLISLLTVSTVFGAEESKKSEEQAKLADDLMVQIKTWQDVAPFAGKIVAYKARSYSFTGNQEDRYPISDDNLLMYGYVIKNLDGYDLEGPRGDRVIRTPEGYSLMRLLKQTGGPSGCPLIGFLLKKDEVLMRCATTEERNKISEALKKEKAQFEYMWPCSFERDAKELEAALS